MKILHVAPIPSSQASGFLHSILGLAQAQANLGYKVAIACSEPDSFSKDLCPDNVQYFKGPITRHKNPYLHPSEWFNNVLSKFGTPDIVNFHGTYIPLHFGLAKFLLSIHIPYIHTPRGDLKSFAQNSKWFKKRIANFLLVNKYLRNAAAIHALTQIELDEIKLRFPSETNKIYIAPNGIKNIINSNDPSTKKSVVNSSSFNLILVGRIDFDIKGIDLILGALLLLEERLPKLTFSFTIVGPFYTTLDERKFNSFLDKFKNKQNIIYRGPLFGNEKIEELKKNDIFICTSRSEGMPMALLEAMSLGLPCLITPGSNAKSYVVDSDSGWYTEADIQSISLKLEEILKLPKTECRRKGNNAKHFALNNFDWNNIAIKNIDIYKKCVHFINT